MKINTEANHLYASQHTKKPAASSTNSASFASALTAATAETAAVKKVDFTSMTRQEMFDWMNSQIRSGNMSFDESTPFLGMTVKISVATGQPVDISTDNTRINFVEKARLGIEGALSRNDPEEAKRLQIALAIMQKNQRTPAGVDSRA